MTKTQAKIGIFMVSSVVTLFGVLIAVTLISQFLTYFQRGADPASIFNGHTLNLPAEDEANWGTDSSTLTIEPTQAQREELIAAYWSAWQSVERAHLTGDTDDLSTYWALPALDQVRASIDPARPFEQTTYDHSLSLTFFSDDHSVAAFDDSFILEQTLNDETMRYQVEATVSLTLDTGRWRIRLLEISLYLIN